MAISASFTKLTHPLTLCLSVFVSLIQISISISAPYNTFVPCFKPFQKIVLPNSGNLES